MKKRDQMHSCGRILQMQENKKESLANLPIVLARASTTPEQLQPNILHQHTQPTGLQRHGQMFQAQTVQMSEEGTLCWS